MKIINKDDHLQHDPQFFVVRGRLKRSNEQPARGEILLAAAREAGHSIVAPREHGLAPIEAIHTRRYLDFLSTVHPRWQTLEDAGEEVVANIHPFPGEPCTYPRHLVGQVGFHLGDMACPIGMHTWKAAYGSAQCAIEAAQLLLEGERAVYALCRPPGHHAYAERANGFCYLNNAAIAAQYLRSRHSRVAILDIDVHHGNGTQGLFYPRSDVLTISLHADPHYMTPFFTGHADERGSGEGFGFNVNYPLPKGLPTEGYLEVLLDACRRIVDYAPGALVVSLGLDTYEHDPYQGVAVSTAGFADIGAAIARLGLPTALIQEGGYLSDALGDNLARVLEGFERGSADARP
ncbi:histone deacetylase family protein [Halotalea alkalilenta]|uniref:Acetylpolyamine aminohydrolase n=1 Tax=Halotalea alkalilenta TaxID=376489 RepID=A0A172YAS7_9GAMM|nr:histone deacetylase family protein [Halotalea alkalilenta]ANF56236.1 acetylpolyamine aminohydrolase [Halotalea alkalilenta]